MKAFYNAATAHEEAVIANQNAFRNILIDAQRDAVLNREAKLLDPTGCLSNSDRCDVVFEYKGGLLTPAQLAPPMPNIVALAGDLRGYAGALKDIADSDAITQVEAAVDEAGGKLGTLVKTTNEVAAKLHGPQVTAAQAPDVDWSVPVTQALKWALGEYVKAAKVDALRAATTAAKEPVAHSVLVYKEADKIVRDGQKANLAQDISEAQTAFSRGRTRANYDRYMQAVSVYQGFVVRGPGDIADKLGAAHAKLAEALDGKPKSLSDAWNLIQQAAAEAEALQKVVAALEDLQKQRQKVQ